MISIFIIMGFFVQSATILMMIRLLDGAGKAEAFFLYTLIYLIFVLILSIPIKKIKSQVKAVLREGMTHVVRSDVINLENDGHVVLANMYWKCSLLGAGIVGSYYSWIIFVVYLFLINGVF